MAASSGAAALLGRQLKQMQTDKDIPGISCGLVNDKNIFEWEVMLMINDDTKYYGGTNQTKQPSLPPSTPTLALTNTYPSPTAARIPQPPLRRFPSIHPPMSMPFPRDHPEEKKKKKSS